MARRQEMVIFTRSFDLLTWLLPITNHFPRAHRFTFTQRLLDAAFDLREHLEMANMRQKKARLEQLRLADEALSKLRVYLRLAARWEWFLGNVVVPAAAARKAERWALSNRIWI